MKQDAVAIVGGGYAGMAAAVALARAGLRPVVFEAARQLGGRARSLRRGEHVLDNGQHLLIGAYCSLLAALQEVGVSPDAALLRMPLRLNVLPHFALQAASLPAPWNLAVGLLRARGISLGARLGCLRFVAWAQRHRFRLLHDTSVAALLRSQRQAPEAIRYLWEPLCVAALNTPAAEASAQVFLHVLRDGLFAGRRASDLLLPRLDLGALFPEPAADYVRARGGEVRTASRVTRLEAAGASFAVHAPGGVRAFGSVIVATQPWQMRALAADIRALAPVLALLDAFAYEPIVTVYLQYAAPPAQQQPLVGLTGGALQWLFDRGAIGGQRGMLAGVISARTRSAGENHALLAQRAAAEIAVLHPELGPAQWTQVIEEKRATFACTPGLARPAVTTPVPGLFLAGDYTAGDYPATLEGAVRSGFAAAEAALAMLQASSARK